MKSASASTRSCSTASDHSTSCHIKQFPNRLHTRRCPVMCADALQEEENQPVGLDTTDWLQSPTPSTPAGSPQPSPQPLSENRAAIAAAQNRENMPESTAGESCCNTICQHLVLSFLLSLRCVCTHLTFDSSSLLCCHQ